LIATEQREIPQRGNVLADQIVRRAIEIASRDRFPGPLRRILVWNRDNERVIALLLALLILKWLHYLSKAGWSLSNLASMLRLNLFTYRDLIAWLHNPQETPPLIPDPEQLLLPIPALGHLHP
jgi:hypothetical protein